MTSQDRRSRSRFWLVAMPSVPLAFSLWWLYTRPAGATSSHYDLVLDRTLSPVVQQREVQLKLRAGSASQTRLLARELAQDSVQYLLPPDLELWAQIRVRVARSSTAACAQLWRGGDSLLGAALVALGDDVLQQWSELLARGLTRRLERQSPPQPAAGAVTRAIAEALAQLPAGAAAAFQLDLTRQDLTDERACQLFLAIEDGAARLEPTERSDFYRARAQQLSRTGQGR